MRCRSRFALPLALTACWWDSDDAAAPSAPPTYAIGGTVSGLSADGLVLANGTDTLTLGHGSTSFAFATTAASGAGYAVVVTAQPAGETCSVTGGSGTVGTAAVGSVRIACTVNTFSVGGSVTGLAAAGLVLANGTDTVSPPANATGFAFVRTVAFGGSYSVTVQQQPTAQTCIVSGSFPPRSVPAT